MRKLLFTCIGIFILVQGFMQTLQCDLPHGHQEFQISTEKILIAFKGNPSLDERNRIISHIPEILPNTDLNANLNPIKFKLSPGLTTQKVIEICKDLNKLDDINFVSPILITGSVKVALTKEIIVKLKSSADLTKLESFAKKYNGEVINLKDKFSSKTSFFYENRFLLKLHKEDLFSILDLSSKLQTSKEFEYAEPNFIQFLSATTNDPMYSSEWGHSQTNVPNAWSYTTGSPGIVVAVIDAGVDLNHPDLFVNLVTGYDATYNPNPDGAQQNTLNTYGGCENTPPANAHGTACAGIIGSIGNNYTGTVGVAYGCKIMPIRLGPVDSDGHFISDNVIKTDAFIASASANVVSCSFAGGLPSITVEQAIDYVTELSPVFASTGNDDFNAVGWPASYPKCIAVGATDYDDYRVDGSVWGWGSNYGPGLDVCAPGLGMPTTDISGSSGYESGDYTSDFDGTSAACPFAAGVAALIYSVNPGLSVAQVRNIIESTCDKTGEYNYFWNYPNGTWSNELGFGRINAGAAVEMAFNMANPSEFSVSVTSSNTLCHNNANPQDYAKISLIVNGGTPFYNGSYYYYQYKVCQSDFSTCHPDIFACYSQLIQGFPMSVSIDFPSGTPTFPYSQTYYFDVWDALGVHQYIPVPVTIKSKPLINGVVSQQQICAGSSVGLAPNISVTGGTNNYTYLWSPSTNLDDPNILQPTAQNVPPGVTNYILLLTDANGCMTTTQVEIDSRQIIANAGTDQFICSGSLASMHASGSAGFLPYSYSWSPGLWLSATNVLNPSISTSNTGSNLYTFTVTDAIGCTASDQVAVSISNVLPQVTTSSLLICPGAITNLQANVSGAYSPYNAQWKSGSTIYPGSWNTSGNIYTSIVSPMATTTYTVTVSDIYGCSATSSSTLTVNPAWAPTISAGNDIMACYYGGATLNATASAGVPPYTYLWTPGNHTGSSYPVNNPATGSVTYTLTVTDNDGCVSIDQVVVTPDDFLNDQIPVVIDAVCPGTSFQVGSHNIFPGVGGVIGSTWPTGGVAPYFYDWQPAYLFVDHTQPYPTTVNPVYEDYCTNLIVTDSRGCVYPLNNDPIGENMGIEVIEQNQPEITTTGTLCSGSFICLTKNTGIDDFHSGFYYLPCGASADPSALDVSESTTYDVQPDGTHGDCITYDAAGDYTVYYTVEGPCTSYTVPYTFHVSASTAVDPSLYKCGTNLSNSPSESAMQIFLGFDDNTMQYCTALVPSGNHAEYIGGEFVGIYPGFSAVAGSEFIARIDLCYYAESPRLERSLSITPPSQLQMELLIFPNPNEGEFTVLIKSNVFDNRNIHITDLSGKMLFTQSVSLIEGENRIYLNENFSPGIYFIQVDGMNDVQKVIISK